MSLEEKIKYIRENEGLSQESFADRLKVSRQSVINWEKGKSTPSFEVLMIIANEFHIEINSLVRNDMKLSYLSVKVLESEFPNKEINPSLRNSEDKPLYVCKKILFPDKVKANFLVSLSCFFGSGMFCWVFVLLDFLWLRWIILMITVGFGLVGIYNLINSVVEFVKSRTSKCLLFQDYYYIQKGIKNKEYITSHIEFCTHINISQSLIGKVFNYGKITIYFKPKSLTIWDCKKPYALKKFIEETYLCKEDFTK